jgi:cell division protein FtsQ
VRNRRRQGSLWQRLPRPSAIVRAIGRGLRRSLPLLIVLVIVGGVGGAAYAGYRFLTTSERFAVTSIVVSGNHALDEAAVRARLGVDEGDNIFVLRPSRLESALAAEPWIARAAVHRELPHTLVVEIVEREAAALVELDGLYLVDGDGHPFKKADLAAGDGAGLAIVTGIGRKELVAAPVETEQRIARAIAAARAWSATPEATGPETETETEARPRIGELHVDARRGLTVYGYDPAIAIHLGVVDGATDALASRLRLFDQAWAALDPGERAAVHTFHLDNDARPDHVTIGMGDVGKPVGKGN